MISTLEIKQFRGFEHIKFEKLGRANLIMGGNNTGKTSILEALALLLSDHSQLQTLPTTFRVMPNGAKEAGQGFWRLLVRNENYDEFLITGGGYSVDSGLVRGGRSILHSIADGPTSRSMITFDANWNCTAHDLKMPSQVAILSTKQADPGVISELFNRIAPLNPDNEAKIEDLLRKSIEPRLRRLRYAKPAGAKTHLVYVDLGEGKMLPFTQMGQAFARTLQVYCEIFGQRPKILLIDEIENGLYYEGMEDFWKGLMAVLEDQDVQLFATTHSRECMEAAYRAAKDLPNDPLRYLRLDRRIDDPAKIVATTFGKEEMATAIEFNREMR